MTALCAPPEERGGWQNHPAVRMWRGSESALGLYMTLCVWEWELRGYRNSIICPYDRRLRPDPTYRWASSVLPLAEIRMPEWLGREDVHASHRSRLLAKDPEWYARQGWDDAPRSEEESYVWPV